MDKYREDVIKVLGKTLGIDPNEIQIGDEADIQNELGIDSIQFINYINGLEEKFGVSFDITELDVENFSSILAIVNLLEIKRLKESELSDERNQNN